MTTLSLSKRKSRLLPLLLAAVVALNGCMSLQPVAFGDDASRNVLDEGDKVIVTLRGGSVREFRLTAVTDAGLQGPGIDIPYSDIRNLQVERVDKTKTTLTVVGVVALVAALASGGDDGSGY